MVHEESVALTIPTNIFVGLDVTELESIVKSKVFVNTLILISSDSGLTDNLTPRLDSKVCIFETLDDANVTAYTMLEIYSTRQRNVFENLIGTWNDSSGFDVTAQSLWERRSDLSSVELKVQTKAAYGRVANLDNFRFR